MTQDDVIRMARKAGAIPIHKDFKNVALVGIENIEAFAKLVTAHEREECAKVCDDLSNKHTWEGCYANECAETIRARGEQE